MQRRDFFSQLLGHVALAAEGVYRVDCAGHVISFYEGERPALPLWQAPEGCHAFTRVCHLTPSFVPALVLPMLAEKTQTQITHTLSSNPKDLADRYILFNPPLRDLPKAPCLLLLTSEEAAQHEKLLAKQLPQLWPGSDLFVGDTARWQEEGSPVHGRIQLYLSRLE